MTQLFTSRSLLRLGTIYLAVPAIIFCLCWLAWPIAAFLTIAICWSMYQVWRRTETCAEQPLAFTRSSFLWIVLVLFVWIALSGIGGLSFQNWDFHWRNALLHDLINYSWPVIYRPSSTAQPQPLAYYMGYWLPSALVGKYLGWEAANLFLMLWTFIGCLLIILGLRNYLHTNTPFPIFLLIFFSGMDVLGVLLRVRFGPVSYPTLWPPIQHLEIWDIQYPSMTTQLFWIFNQAIPVWLFMVLLLNDIPIQTILFLWALCFFYSPFGALGAAPFLMADIVRVSKEQRLWSSIRQFVSLENFMAGLGLFLVCALMFSANRTPVGNAAPSASPTLVIVSAALEWLILWAMLFPQNVKDFRWLLCGELLLLCEFLRVGIFNFGGWIAIPSLFILMTGAGRYLLAQRGLLRGLLVACLVLGAVTPLYEINRSIVRTAQYYIVLASGRAMSPGESDFAEIPRSEDAHPGTLVADELQTLGEEPSVVTSYWGNSHSIFYLYILRH